MFLPSLSLLALFFLTTTHKLVTPALSLVAAAAMLGIVLKLKFIRHSKAKIKAVCSSVDVDI